MQARSSDGGQQQQSVSHDEMLYEEIDNNITGNSAYSIIIQP